MITPQWLIRLLNDSQITDICLNGNEDVFVDDGNGLCPVSTSPSNWNVREWVLERLSEAGKTWDAKYPFFDLTLSSGHRVHAVFPPLSPKGVLVSLRKIPTKNPNSSRWVGDPRFDLLARCYNEGDSVLISGATGSGKTTLATDLVSCLPKNTRVIALEDTEEINPNHPHFLRLLTRTANSDGFGEVTLRALLREVLRMRPDRIVLGECRGSEVLDLLQALNTGHKGALATVHANSCRDSIRRLEILVQISLMGRFSKNAVSELIATGIQWIVHIKRNGNKRTISEICQVVGKEGDTILLRPMVGLTQDEGFTHKNSHFNSGSECAIRLD